MPLSLADLQAWKPRLALCLALSLALHASLLRIVRPSPAPAPRLPEFALSARLTGPPAQAEAAVAIAAPGLAPAPRLARREPDPAPKPAAETPLLQPERAVEAPARDDEPVDKGRLRLAIGAATAAEPDPLPEIRIDGLDPAAFLKNESASRPADLLNEPVFPPPVLPRGDRRRGTVQALVFIDEAGAVLAVALLNEEEAGALADSARRGLLGARFEPALLDGRPVRARVSLEVNFRYD